MIWIIPAWILSLIGIFLFGYFCRGLVNKIEYLEELVKSKVDKNPTQEEPRSQLIDPTDPVQTAIYEHNKMMEKLNGKS